MGALGWLLNLDFAGSGATVQESLILVDQDVTMPVTLDRAARIPFPPDDVVVMPVTVDDEVVV